jgi:hypothetical protein
MKKTMFVALGSMILVASIWIFYKTPVNAQFQFPTFTSAVNGVQIVGVEVNQRTNELDLTVQNSTSKAITGISLSCGDGTIGLVDRSGNPINQPYRSLVTHFPIPNLQAGKPLSISAVLWSDGTSEGYPWQAEFIKKGETK